MKLRDLYTEFHITWCPTKEEAKELLEQYLNDNPDLRQAMQRAREMVKDQGGITNAR